MKSEKEQEKQDAVNKILIDLSKSQNILKEAKTRRDFFIRLEEIYYNDNADNFRHYYSDIFSTLTMIDNDPLLGSLEILAQNRFEANTTEKLKEYVTINISIPDGEGTFDTFMSQEIELDPYFFNKLINKGNWKANDEIQKIADKVLVLRHR